MSEEIKKEYKIKVKFVFEGTVDVLAETEEKAVEIVENNFHLVLGEDIEETNDMIKDWNFNVHPEKIVK